MANTINLRNRQVAYDNLAVGSDTASAERTIAGSAPPAQTWGQGENIAVGSDYGPELIIEKTTALITNENI